MPEVVLKQDQVNIIKANAIEANDRLLSVLNGLTEGTDKCKLRHAVFNVTMMLHQVNLAEGTAK